VYIYTDGIKVYMNLDDILRDKTLMLYVYTVKKAKQTELSFRGALPLEPTGGLLLTNFL